MRFLIALSVLLVCAAASAGDVYKWKDKDGRVHYGDQPKHDAEAVNVTPGSGTGEPSEDLAKQQAREAECQKRRAQVETYRKAPGISEVDSLGKSREFSPAEREQFIALQEQKAQAACAPPAQSAESAPAQ